MDTPIVPDVNAGEGAAPVENAEETGAEGAEKKVDVAAGDDNTGGASAPKGSGAANAAAAAAKRKYQLKYGDKIEEVEEAELIRRAQKVTGIEKKAEEAAKQHKIATSFFKMMKEDPAMFAKRAKEIGMDPEAMAVEIINAKLKYEQMTPEQRELEQLRQDKAVSDREKKERLEREHREKLEAETAEYRNNLEKEIVDAFTSVKLPKTPWTTARIAAYLDAGLANGKQYKVVDVAKIVQKEHYAMVNEVLGAFPEDQILDFLKPEIQETISRARVKRLTPKPAVPAVPAKPAAVKPEPKLNPRRHKLIRQYLHRDDTPTD